MSKLKLLEFLYKRLHSHGVEHVFGIPGESIHKHYHYLEKSSIKSVVMTHEPSVGYAADAYSRIKGIGVALVSYGVGSLNLVNAVGQAYAETSPMIVLSGGPGLSERRKFVHLHHKVRSYETHQRVMSEVTAYSVILTNPITAASDIDKAISTAMELKRPVYIEVPRDMCEIEIYSEPINENNLYEDKNALEESLSEVIKMLNSAERPVIIAGAEPARINKQKEVKAFIEKVNIPVASTLLGKSIFPEDHPLSMGVYFGKLSNPKVEEYINDSDCILMLGAILSDINLGMFTAELPAGNAICSNLDGLKVKNHFYPQIGLSTFINGLLDSKDLKRHDLQFPAFQAPNYPANNDDEKITIKSMMTVLNDFISDKYRVISDVGDCLFASLELQMRGESSYLSPAYYLSMGFAVPGSIGAQFADSSRRPLVLVGDGAFQMTGTEVLTAAKEQLNPIIVVLNNTIYGTLRHSEPVQTKQEHKIPSISYAKFAEVMGGKGIEINTIGDLKAGLKAAKGTKDTFTLLDLKIDENDVSPALKIFGEKMGSFNESSASGDLN